MEWYQILMLSILEMVAIVAIWSGFNEKFNRYKIRSLCIVMGMSLMAAMFNVYDVNMDFIIHYIVLCTMVITLLKVPVKDTIIQFLIVLIIIFSIQFSLTYFLSTFRNTNTYSFVNGLIINTFTLLVSMIIYKLIMGSKVKQNYLKYSNYTISITINITGMVLLLIYMWEMNQNFVWNHIVYLLLAMVIWEALNIFFLYQSIRIKEQEKMIDIHEKYTPILKDMVDEVREMQHESKNHLNVLYGLVQIEDALKAKEEIAQYLEVLIEGMKSTDQLLNIKEPVLSAIIYSKKSLAEKQGIYFHVEFCGEIPVFPLVKYELVELLGNLLDNAIEAAEDSSSVENPKVFLTLGIEANYSMIEVKNTGGIIKQENIERIFERGFSTKKGKHRGYGLYHVKKIVDRYQGTIELSFDGDCTVLKILL
ncbi:signal transduction histidine kinase regulating citrate/malate metabolism [Alkaliphilus metalliredigens QYMF]|uniref:Signal transduction histidine kinase regulating citrate/malate metabolism n=1 Tax=Alkaliphilus metalliredigens (strain QYMF) TaxID=293826 RepID=A6TVE9_ALKMQ|nr:GHKL domain-containing protein [Alkaliphilus metalliredigens]ABR50167.1 signal transduction histidine kinase regulating citrate/malate metabolism [Alkaliphilus metalliredigens QYMF]